MCMCKMSVYCEYSVCVSVCVGEFWLNGGFWQCSALFFLAANIRGAARHVMESFEISMSTFLSTTPQRAARDGSYCGVIIEAGHRDNLFTRMKKNAAVAPSVGK